MRKKPASIWHSHAASLLTPNWQPFSLYSGTSVSGPSQQRPTSLQRPKRRVRIDFSIDLTHFEPPNNGNGNLQTPASGQRPGSGTLYFRRKLPPRTAKFKTTPLFVKPHPFSFGEYTVTYIPTKATSLQGPNALIPKWPFFGGSTVLAKRVSLNRVHRNTQSHLGVITVNLRITAPENNNSKLAWR